MRLFILVCCLFFVSCTHMKKVGWVLSSNPFPNSKKSVANGAKIYEEHCLSCHGERGNGKGELSSTFKVRPSNLVHIAKDRWDSTFAAHVAYGKSGNEDMPKFVETLKENQIWDVTNYIYSLR